MFRRLLVGVAILIGLTAFLAGPAGASPPLSVPCEMTVQMDSTLQAAGAKVDIRHGPSGLSHGDKFQVTEDKSFEWRLVVNGFSGQYQTVDAECGGNLQVLDSHYCVLGITIPAELESAGGKVLIRYSSFGPLGPGDTRVLPYGISIQWRLKVNGFEGDWQTKPVDCSAIAVTAAHYCDMKVNIAEAVKDAGGKVSIRYSSLGLLADGAAVLLPADIGIQWRLHLNSFEGPWQAKDVDCTPIVVGLSHYCAMSIVIPEPAKGAGARVIIRYSSLGLLADGDVVLLPAPIGIQWRLRLNGFEGDWHHKTVDCTPLTVAEGDFCAMTVVIPEPAKAAGARVSIRYSSLGLLADGDEVLLPIDITIQWQLHVNSFSGPHQFKPVDCTPLVVPSGAFCAMKVVIPEPAKSAGAKVSIRYSSLGLLGDGAVVVLPTGIAVQWRLHEGSSTTAYESKPVDCSDLVVPVEPADETPPEITVQLEGTAGAGGWFVSDVTVTWTVVDAESAVTSQSGCEQTTIASDTTGVTITCTATSAGGTSSESVTVRRDATPPDIVWNGAIHDGDAFHFGAVPDGPTCSAADDTSGPAACQVTGHSDAVGPHTLRATAWDVAGNEAIEFRQYTVLAWTLVGFFSPVEMGGAWNSVKGGSTVPLKFRVLVGSQEQTDIGVIAGFSLTAVDCSGEGQGQEAEFVTTGGTSLRYDAAAGQFIQNWRTPRSSGSCHLVTMTTRDGSQLVAGFKLR